MARKRADAFKSLEKFQNGRLEVRWLENAQTPLNPLGIFQKWTPRGPMARKRADAFKSFGDFPKMDASRSAGSLAGSLAGSGWLWLWLTLALAGSGWLWLALAGSGWLCTLQHDPETRPQISGRMNSA